MQASWVYDRLCAVDVGDMARFSSMFTGERAPQQGVSSRGGKATTTAALLSSSFPRGAEETDRGRVVGDATKYADRPKNLPLSYST